MGVVRGRQSGADVQELADTCLAGQEPDSAGQEMPLSAGDVDYPRENPGVQFPGFLVDRIIVLANNLDLAALIHAPDDSCTR